jgi:hypothetical protein
VRVALLVVALVCAGCGAATGDVGTAEPLERYGIAVTPPPGWHVRLSRATVEAATVPLAAPGQKPKLGPDDVSVLLFESEPGPQGFLDASEYRAGPPDAFTAADFGPPEFSGTSWGHEPKHHSFARRNFMVAGRYFDLFVEAGAPPSDVAALNALVASFEVRAGDFYPGTIEPPRFPPADGWWVGAAGAGEVRATDVAEVWAATVPYRNGPRELPPTDTLEALPADGILIWVGLARDNRFPPTAELRGEWGHDGSPIQVPLRLSAAHGCACYEGVPDNWLYRLYGSVGEQYYVDLWVFFGGTDEPSAEEYARAQAMLDRLELPDWAPWELDGRGDVVG